MKFITVMKQFLSNTWTAGCNLFIPKPKPKPIPKTTVKMVCTTDGRNIFYFPIKETK
jgi:hypothetical protein